MDALKRYQVNQHHLPVVAKVKDLSESILAVDFTF
jgi:hypothetical protein